MLRPNAPSFHPDAPSFRPQKDRSPRNNKQMQKSNPKKNKSHKEGHARELKLERSNSGGRHSKSNRSTRADHLLNFSAAPIQSNPSEAPRWVAKRKPPPKSYLERRQDVKKFLNSRFRFMLSSSASCTVQNDEFWKQVAYVGYLADPETRCSICLDDELVAPQVTKCGHMYCLPCIMRYYENQSRFARCPVCFHTVDRTEIKPVEISPQIPVQLNTPCQMKLLKCQKRPPWIPVSPEAHHPSSMLESDHPDARFSKHVRGSQEDRIKLQSSYAQQLHTAKQTEQDPTSLEFLQRAERVVANMWTNCPGVTEPDPAPATPETRGVAESHEDPIDDFELPMLPAGLMLKSRHHCKQVPSELQHTHPETTHDGSPGEGQEEPSEAPSEDLVFDENADAISDTPEAQGDDLCFYQAGDGQPVFLWPLNQQMLEHQFGSLLQAPHIWDLELPVLEVESSVVTAKMSSKHTCLWNLPIGSEVCFVELDLSPLLKQQTIQHFSEQLKKRAKARKRRAAAAKKLKQSKQTGEIGQEFMAMLQQGRANILEPAPDIDELGAFPKLEFPAEVESPSLPPETSVTESPSSCGISFSNVTAHGYAATAPPLLTGQEELFELERPAQTAVQGVWGTKPCVTSHAQPMQLDRRASREVEHGEIAAPTLSDFLFKGSAKKQNKKDKQKKKKGANHMQEFDK